MRAEPMDLCREVGIPMPSEAVSVAIGGADPVLSSKFPVGERAATALAACGIAAATLWHDRTGEQQHVAVDTQRAAISLISFMMQRLDGEPTLRDAANNALVALYECADGRWIHLHAAFPKLIERTVKVLGGGAIDDRKGNAALVAKWNGQDLEDALAEVGACGAMVRTAQEWAAHRQSDALLPLGRVAITKIGDSDPEPVGDGVRPLGGVRVLDLTRVLAGPTNARVLAEHGADVLHINGSHLDNVAAFVMDTGHGKRSASLDLNNDVDATALRALVADADVFSQGYRGDALAKRGFGPDALAELRPGIVAVTINCYGDVGPWRLRPGWEQLAQSVTGIAAAQGTPTKPELINAAAADYTTGYLAALGTMAALRRRAIQGGSYHVQASLCQTAMWIAEDGPWIDPSSAVGLGDNYAEWMTTTATPFGELRHMTPVAQLSKTPGRWDLPSVPLGTHSPSW